ncbi:1-cys-glutaredoxin protein-1, putative [Perkinsus marinus ATCC 50983]|uniref:Glutaredoxin n=1 Tax=Perkinsus marinus (strain ATCC 50983 / TXsc) TaxID=423536 RepID=C5LJ78_PERM5|nr:1-cys-glutaredoxin protein-1, putative [Perkinsus marinus ATCC 50983]EER03194.1 1-cys-glutaredoxin protein-1, putative [Perkinsus marinus ATCC 50983]|eukprot:XP_002771378.1 1-cys-glutaredoxin protein-1, putative [Perkinsus marinus ATCC 50983]
MSYEELLPKLDAFVKANKVVLFMKGDPEAPKCGFSKKVVETLQKEGVKSFAHMNILANDVLREGVKKYSDWPTYPQLYVDGEFVGGCDIVLQMAEDGELHDLLLEKGAITA